MDSDGGVWIVRSGNAPGFGHGEIDYIKNDEITVYKAEDLYPDISEDDDIRLLVTDKKDKDVFYIGTLRSGVVKSEGIGNITEKYNGSTVFNTNQWNNAYFIDWSEDNLMIGTNGGGAVQANRSTFQDVKSHWSENEVEKMITLGYIKGSNGQFRPDDSITRGEFVALMVRVLGLETNPDETDFNDVSSDDWFAPYISSAVSQGIIKGYDDGTFKPQNPITREEISSLLSSIIDLKLSEEEVEEILSEFKDQVSPWARPYVAKTVKSGLLKGFPDNSFKGSSEATRAQSAVMLLRFLSN